MALNFSFKNYYKEKLSKTQLGQGKHGQLFTNIIAGGMAGSSGMIFVFPLELVRTRLGVDIGKGSNKQYNGIVDCFGKIYIQNGIKGLYQGLGVSMTSIFVYRGLYFGLYDSGKTLIPSLNQDSILQKYLLAQVVTIGSETLTYPFDTVRI